MPRGNSVLLAGNTPEIIKSIEETIRSRFPEHRLQVVADDAEVLGYLSGLTSTGQNTQREACHISKRPTQNLQKPPWSALVNSVWPNEGVQVIGADGQLVHRCPAPWGRIQDYHRSRKFWPGSDASPDATPCP